MTEQDTLEFSRIWKSNKYALSCRHKNLLLQRFDKLKTKPRAEKTAQASLAGESQQVQAAWGNARRQVALREEILAREKQAPAVDTPGLYALF